MTGIVAMTNGGDLLDFVQARDWARQTIPTLAFTPEQVVAASAKRLELPTPYDEPGVYFLIRGGRVCYVGKAKQLASRLAQHRRDRRPFDRVSAIAGIHWEFIGQVEAAYVTAWQPPWNHAAVYGYGMSAELTETLAAMDLSLVCRLPEFGLTPGEAADLADRL